MKKRKVGYSGTSGKHKQTRTRSSRRCPKDNPHRYRTAALLVQSLHGVARSTDAAALSEDAAPGQFARCSQLASRSPKNFCGQTPEIANLQIFATMRNFRVCFESPGSDHWALFSQKADKLGI